MAKISYLTDRAGTILNDAGFTRWTSAELLRWYNDGVREVVILDPAAYSTHATITLVAGAKQSLPTGAVALLDVVGNVGGKEIIRCDRGAMDAFLPGWPTSSQSSVIQNFMYSAVDRKTFYVYPPALVGSQIEIVHSSVPTEETNTANISTTDIVLDAQYFTPLLDFMLYKAYAKDAEEGNMDVAAGYKKLFIDGVDAIVSRRGN